MANRYGQDGRAQDDHGRVDEGRDDRFQNDAPHDDGFANRPSFMRGPAGPQAQPSVQPSAPQPADQYDSDPLAELARLIGQTDPFSNFGRTDAPAAPASAARHLARERTPAGQSNTHPSNTHPSDTHPDAAAFRHEQPMLHPAPQYEAPAFHPAQMRADSTQNASRYNAADHGSSDHPGYGGDEPQWGRHPADGRIGDDDAAPIPSFLTQSREYARDYVPAQMPEPLGRAPHPQDHAHPGGYPPRHSTAQGDDPSRYDPVLYGGAPHVPSQQDAYGGADAYRGQGAYGDQDGNGAQGYGAQGNYSQQGGGYDPRYDNYDPNLVDPYGQPYDDREAGAGREQSGVRKPGGMITIAAIIALAVVGTLGAYAYRSFMSPSRSGAPPIIKADTTPNKIVPPKKDGESGSKAIYDRIGGSGNSASATLVPREEAPVDVKPSASSPRVVFPALNQPNQPAGQSARPQDGIAALAAASARAPEPAEDSKKIRTVTIRPDQPAAAAPEPQPDPAPVPLRTQNAQRPRAGADANASAAATSGGPINIAPQGAAPNTTRVANIQPASAPAAAEQTAAGGYLVQISSQRSENDARNSYRALQGKFPSVLGTRNPVIKRADLGTKGVYYRAMVGPFDNSGDASQFCSELKSAGGQCVIQRN